MTNSPFVTFGRVVASFILGSNYDTQASISIRTPGFEFGRTFPLTARNASVLATTIAAEDDNPAPAGTIPVTRRLTGTG